MRLPKPLYWTPDISFAENGTTALSFYAADTPSTYEVRIEGISDSGVPLSFVYEVEVK